MGKTQADFARASLSLAQSIVQDWRTHQCVCAKCYDVDVSKTSTLANTCINGARILKEALHAASKHKDKTFNFQTGEPLRNRAPDYPL